MKAQIIALILMFSGPSALAVIGGCAEVLGEARLREGIEQISQSLNPGVSPAWGQYLALPESAKVALPQTSVVEILSTDENPVLQDRLAAAISAAAGDLSEYLRTQLEKRLSPVAARERVEAFQRDPSVENLSRALGKMTLQEHQIAIHGGDPLQPTASSLVGRYIAETGAATVVRTFPRGPGKQGEGPRKLAVAISAASFETFKKYFADPHLLGHAHGVSQGHLYLTYNGKTGGAEMGSDLRVPGTGALFPFILLNTSEAARATLFFKLGASAGRLAVFPWSLQGYCLMGGYNSCTHWFGNIPIGDRLVNEYAFPGRVDAYANNPVPAGPQIGPLGPYQVEPAAHSPAVRRLVERVWTVPGHEQLADVLGTRQNNLDGEWANPGWVLHVLTAEVNVDRVPVVFYFVQDHQTALDPTFPMGSRPQ